MFHLDGVAAHGDHIQRYLGAHIELGRQAVAQRLAGFSVVFAAQAAQEIGMVPYGDVRDQYPHSPVPPSVTDPAIVIAEGIDLGFSTDELKQIYPGMLD